MGEEVKILLILAKGFEDIEAVTVIDACGWTSYKPDIVDVTLVTSGLHDRVSGRYGITIEPDVLVDEVDAKEFDAVVLPGGFDSHGYEEAYDERILSIIRDVHSRGGVIATMCVGALPVAKAGLLNGKRAATYPFSRNHDRFEMLRSFGASAADGPVVIDDRIISSTGPAHSVDVVLRMFEQLIEKDSVAEIRKLMSGIDA